MQIVQGNDCGQSASLPNQPNSLTAAPQANSAFQRDQNGRLTNPAEVLSEAGSAAHVVELVHAGTLFSAGAVKDGKVIPEVSDYFAQARRQGVNTVYIVGVYRTSVFSELVMPYFAQSWAVKPNPAHLGPSVFSIDDYEPNGKIGSWANLKTVVDHAKAQGVTVVIDFIPNTIAVDSQVSRDRLDLVQDYSMPSSDLARLENLRSFWEQKGVSKYSKSCSTGAPPNQEQHELKVFESGSQQELFCYVRTDKDGGKFSLYSQRSLNGGFFPYAWIVQEAPQGQRSVFCKRLGTDGYTAWADVFMLDTPGAKVQSWQAEKIAQLSQVVSIVRADMSHLPPREYWSKLRKQVESRGTAMPEVWGEAYGYGVHDELAARKVLTYANFIRDWLHQPNMRVADLKRQLFENAQGRTLYERSMSIAYTANHDDAMGSFLPREAAKSAILTALPVPIVMLAQGQRHGDTTRYGADQHVPLPDFKQSLQAARQKDPEYAAFMDSLLLLMNKEVFRSQASGWSPVQFKQMQNCDPDKIFHIVRKHGSENVLCVVTCEGARPASKIEVDVSATFGVAPADLGQYSLVNLIDGRVFDAQPAFTLTALKPGVGFETHMYALVPKSRL